MVEEIAERFGITLFIFYEPCITYFLVELLLRLLLLPFPVISCARGSSVVLDFAFLHLRKHLLDVVPLTPFNLGISVEIVNIKSNLSQEQRGILLRNILLSILAFDVDGGLRVLVDHGPATFWGSNMPRVGLLQFSHQIQCY